MAAKASKCGTDKECLRRLSSQLAETSAKKIVETLLPAFGDKLPLYTIALSTKSINRTFLERCSMLSTNRSDAFQIVTRKNLIAAANTLFPKGPKVINIYQRRLDRPGNRPIDDAFQLPLSLKKVRFVVNYLDAGVRKDDVQIQIHLPNGQVLGKGGEESNHFIAQTPDGSLVFERFILPIPVPYGQGRVVVRRKGGRVLPRMLIVAEGIISQGALTVTLTPPQPEAGDHLVIEARVEENGRIVPAQQIRGKIYTPSGSTVPISLRKNPDGSFRQTYGIPLDARGKHVLLLTAVLDKKMNQTISGQTEFIVTPANPVKLRFEIPFGGTPTTSMWKRRQESCQGTIALLFSPSFAFAKDQGHDSLAPDCLVFPTLGCEQRRYSIKGVRIINESKRPARVKLRLTPLTNNEGDVLDARKWLTISPSTGISVASSPFTFSLRARFPKKIPGDLENGTYRGSIIVESPNGNTLNIPVAVPIEVPSFTGLPRRIDFTAYWRVPCTLSRNLHLEIDGQCPVKGRVICTSLFKDSDENYVDRKRLSLSTEKPDFEIQEGKSASVGLSAKLGSKLKTGKYDGMINVTSNVTRLAVVPVRVTVPKPLWNPWPYKGPCYRGNILQCIFAMGGLLFLLGAVRRIATSRLYAYRKGRTWSGNPKRALAFRDPGGTELFTIKQDSNGTWMLRPARGQSITTRAGKSFSPVKVEKNMTFECGEESQYAFEVTMLSRGRVQAKLIDTPYSDAFLGRARRLMIMGVAIVVIQQIIARLF